MKQTNEITSLLRLAQAGESGALEELVSSVYEPLRRMARRELRREFRPSYLSTTTLVHEAYLKLVDHESLPTNSRAHFFGSAARAMRRILIEEARRRSSLKRGAGMRRVELESRELHVDAWAEDLLVLDDALDRLSILEERLVRVVECRFFAGLTVEETAATLGSSTRTVKRDWRKAKGWLHQELRGPGWTA